MFSLVSRKFLAMRNIALYSVSFIVLATSFTKTDSRCQSEVPRLEIFMEQELRFGLDLGRMANFPAFIASNQKHFQLCLAPLETPHHGTSL